MKKLLAILILLAVVGCPSDSCDSVTSPDMNPDGGQQPPIEPDPIPDEPEPEPINPGPQIDLRSMDGFSAFAICGRDEQTQRQVWKSARNRGYAYGRVLSESAGWKGNRVFDRVAGKPIRWGKGKNGQLVVENKGALAEFKECLRIAAEEDMGMLAMGIVTSLRRKGTDEQREAWLRAIGKAAQPYNNVAWEVANEYSHPNSQIDRPSFLNRMQRVLRQTTAGDLVGADQGLGAQFSNTARYRYDYRVRSDFPSFHPWRNPDPTAEDIRDIVRENGGWALLSETTSWTADEADLEIFGWLVTTSKSQIQLYMNRCRPSEGCAWVYHSIEGLFTEGRFTWMPQRGMSSQSESGGVQGTGRPQVYMY